MTCFSEPGRWLVSIIECRLFPVLEFGEITLRQPPMNFDELISVRTGLETAFEGSEEAVLLQASFSQHISVARKIPCILHDGSFALRVSLRFCCLSSLCRAVAVLCEAGTDRSFLTFGNHLGAAGG